MAEFSVNINTIRGYATHLGEIRLSDVLSHYEDIKNIHNYYSFPDQSLPGIEERLMKVIDYYEDYMEHISELEKKLYKIADEYKRRDQQLSRINYTQKSGKDLMNTSSEQKDSMINQFEKVHPEYAEKINSFLGSGENNCLTEEDIRNIKYIAYNAQEPFRSIFLNSLDKYRIGNGDTNGGSYYTPFEHVVNLNYYDPIEKFFSGILGRKDSFSDDPRGPFVVFFHECGHAIDDLSDTANYYGYDTFGYSTYNETMGRDVTIAEAIEYDVFSNRQNPHSIISIAENIASNSSEYESVDLNRILESYKNGNKNGLSEIERKMYDEVKKNFTGSLGNIYNYEAVTDVYGGMTNNILRGGYEYLGHDDNYWSEREVTAQDLWAEYFSYNMAGSTENLHHLREYFPEAVKVMEQYALSLAV